MEPMIRAIKFKDIRYSLSDIVSIEEIDDVLLYQVNGAEWILGTGYEDYELKPFPTKRGKIIKVWVLSSPDIAYKFVLDDAVNFLKLYDKAMNTLEL